MAELDPGEESGLLHIRRARTPGGVCVYQYIFHHAGPDGIVGEAGFYSFSILSLSSSPQSHAVPCCHAEVPLSPARQFADRNPGYGGFYRLAGRHVLTTPFLRDR